MNIDAHKSRLYGQDMPANGRSLLDTVRLPAFIIDMDHIRKRVDDLNCHINGSCELLYSIKALPVETVIHNLSEYLCGFSVSSLFEARLVRNTCNRDTYIHYISPIIHDYAVDEIAILCNRVTFNSWGQLARFADRIAPHCSIGIRVNPGISHVSDDRYNPCRRHSKLGVSLSDIASRWQAYAPLIEGIHFHNACNAESWNPALETINVIDNFLCEIPNGLKWINIGGGVNVGPKA